VTAEYGNLVEEHLTGAALKAVLDSVSWNPTFKGLHPVWSGRPDFVIGHGTDNVTIIEHKVTGGDHKPERWKIPSPYFPVKEHVAQLYLYGYLYNHAYGVMPTLILFYRTFKHHAQFEIQVSPLETLAVGHIDGTPYETSVDINPIHIIAEYERMFTANEVPQAYKPGEKGYGDHCVFFGKPSCDYFDLCHNGAEMVKVEKLLPINSKAWQRRRAKAEEEKQVRQAAREPQVQIEEPTVKGWDINDISF
jgi:hypothetical protein